MRVQPVEALVIPSPRLRDVLVAEAELGERIMRALILRRVGLLETGVGGPVIVGRADDGDVLRLAGFLARNGHPHQTLDPDTRRLREDAGRALPRRPVGAADRALPERTAAAQPERGASSRAASASCGRSIRTRSTTSPSSAPARPGLAAAVYAASEGLSVLVLDCRAFGGQAGASARIENYLGFPTGIRGMALMARAFNQAQKFGAEMAIPDEVVRLRCRADGERRALPARPRERRARAARVRW